MQVRVSRHAQQDLPVHGFDGAFVMTMFTAPVSPKAFSKRKISGPAKKCWSTRVFPLARLMPLLTIKGSWGSRQLG
jgi:hypothetical protein